MSDNSLKVRSIKRVEESRLADLRETDQIIGSRITTYRTRRGLSREALALMVTIPPRELDQIEDGDLRPEPEVMVRLAQALGATIVELMRVQET